MTTAPPDDVVTLLEEDHREVEDRFAELDQSAPGERGALLWNLTDRLVRHEVAEEVVVYPALRSVPGGDAIADARIAEQSEAERQLARVEKLDPQGHELERALAELKSSVLDHARREEAEAFPLLAGSLPSNQLVELGERYSAAKRAAPNHPHPHAPDTPPGNKILGPVAALADRIRDEMGSVTGR